MYGNAAAGSVSGTGDRRPMRFLMVVWLITVLVLLVSVWSAFHSYQQYVTTTKHTFQIQELRGRIVHLDEVLTMSTLMAAATGDPQWERRYRQFEAELDAAIQDAIALVPDAGGTEQTDAANAALIEMENTAFELVRQGELKASREILSGDEYARKKAIYAEGMTILGGQLASSADTTLKARRQWMLIQLFSIAAVIAILVVGWFVVIRVLHRWRNELAQSHRHLVELNRDLDRKVADRTAELEQATEEAKGANEVKSAFLANMSHELRTPMNAIIGYSEMLIEESEALEQDDVIPDLEKILSAGNHLLALINEILDLSKIEAGRMDLFLEDFSVSSLINEVTATVDTLVKKKGNVLVKHGEYPGEIRADLTKVRQSLFNLLSNAAKFTEKGTITLSVMHQDDEVAFAVSDTGIGVAPDKIDKLFEPFTQADASTTRKFGGTGLGLAITKRFCEMMGGSITVTSKPGEGSTFTIRLPTVVTEPGDEASSEQGVADFEPGKCVLVIDDDPSARDLLERTLSKDGAVVVTAADGDEGLALARELQPKAITLDVMMPGKDGWAVLQELKADPDLREIPVIMVSIEGERKLGYTLGAAEYLTKPLDRRRLSEIVTRYRQSGEASGLAMVVEDDASTREILRRTLENDGWAVSEAVNGRVALDQLCRESEPTPLVILLDLMMPVMDGFEFLHELRQIESLRGVPVVVLTANDLSDSDRQRLNCDVESILEKGALEKDDLLRQVRNALAHGR